jgi:iron complex transport system substrate-binding protein
MRVVSLLPSATEMVAALGALENLVGITHCCDHPAVVGSRARLTRTAVNAHAAPGVIDRQVRDLLATGAPLYEVDAELLRALHPDVIITQALCEVCAVSETDVRAIAAQLSPVPIILTLNAHTVEEILGDIAQVGAVLGRRDEAEEELAGLHARIRRVHETLKGAKAPRPRVAVIEWSDPIFAAGHWVPDQVKRAGGIDVLATAGEHSVTVTVDQVRAADPEIVLMAPCGMGLDAAIADARAMLARDEWSWLRDRAVWALDANAFTSRPGPRVVDGIEVMARIFNPQLFTELGVGMAQSL